MFFVVAVVLLGFYLGACWRDQIVHLHQYSYDTQDLFLLHFRRHREPFWAERAKSVLTALDSLESNKELKVNLPFPDMGTWDLGIIWIVLLALVNGKDFFYFAEMMWAKSPTICADLSFLCCSHHHVNLSQKAFVKEDERLMEPGS